MKIAGKILVSLLLLIAVCLAGCYSETEDTTRKWSRVSERNRLMLIDDFESFMFLDQPSQLSRWKVLEQ